MAKRDKAYRVVRVTTVIEICHVRMPTKKLAEKWAKPSDAVSNETHTTGWKADAQPMPDSPIAGWKAYEPTPDSP